MCTQPSSTNLCTLSTQKCEQCKCQQFGVRLHAPNYVLSVHKIVDFQYTKFCTFCTCNTAFWWFRFTLFSTTEQFSRTRNVILNFYKQYIQVNHSIAMSAWVAYDLKRCPEKFGKRSHRRLVAPCGGECIRSTRALRRHIHQRRYIAECTHAYDTLCHLKSTWSFQ